MIVTMDMATGQWLDEEEGVPARELVSGDRVAQPVARLALQESSSGQPMHHVVRGGARRISFATQQPALPLLH